MNHSPWDSVHMPIPHVGYRPCYVHPRGRIDFTHGENVLCMECGANLTVFVQTTTREYRQ